MRDTLEGLSKFFLHFSRSLISTCCVFYDSLYAEIKEENRLFIFSTSCIFSMFSETFEKQFKTLIARKFNTEFMSSVLLSMGITEATFAFSASNLFYTIVN